MANRPSPPVPWAKWRKGIGLVTMRHQLAAMCFPTWQLMTGNRQLETGNWQLIGREGEKRRGKT